MIKTYKIRLFPTPEQEKKMWQHIGTSRWIWNYMLAEQERRYEAGEPHLSTYDMNNLLKPLKQKEEFAWLYEVSHSTLQHRCADLSNAYKAFFEHNAKHPKYKSKKKSKPSFPIRDDVGCVYFTETSVTIASIGKVAYKTDHPVPLGRKQKFSNPRVQFTAKGKWILTIGYERENQAPTELTGIPMGIDLGIKELAVVSFGDEQIVFHNINKSRKVRQFEQRLKHLERNVSRKEKIHGKGVKTKNLIKARQKVAEVYYHLANIRQNYIHQTTHQLVSMLPSRVVMEDLNVSGMMKNRHLSKAVQEQKFYEFRLLMKYKCEERGIEFVLADRFYPSSKTCSCCGRINHDLKLKDRVFKCECGAELDRDYNAAINLMKYVAQPTMATA